MYLEEGIYFVTTYIHGRIPFFRNPDIAKIMMESIEWTRSSQYFLYAYVVMPDHLHLLVQPTKGNISEIMRSIKTNSSREIHRYLIHNRGRATSVMTRGDKHTLSAMDGVMDGARFRWQLSFYDRIITDDEDFRNHIEYIRYNPVKARLVPEPKNYPFLYVNDTAIRTLFGG